MKVIIKRYGKKTPDEMVGVEYITIPALGVKVTSKSKK